MSEHSARAITGRGAHRPCRCACLIRIRILATATYACCSAPARHAASSDGYLTSLTELLIIMSRFVGMVFAE